MSRFDPERPGADAAFYKGHGLGNDYLVVHEGADWTVDEAAARRVCDRHQGVGSDGIVVVLGDPPTEPFRLRMFNPDGSEFERSGNGLRVLASWLLRSGRVVRGAPFEVEVGGDRIRMTVHERGPGGEYDVSVEMGRARTGPDAVGLDPAALRDEGGMAGSAGTDVADTRETLDIDDGPVPVRLVSIGNPHCVVFTDHWRELGGPQEPWTLETLRRVGPSLATHPAFPRGTNVQLARVVEGGGGAPDAGGGVVEALVWERGAGHTTASGTSSCAVAVAAVESGRLRPGPVEVRMEGGSLRVDVSADLDLVLRGPVREVCAGVLEAGFLEALSESPSGLG